MVAQPHSFALPRDTIPGYELLDLLGQGGAGAVYRARQENLDRVVALKIVDLTRLDVPSLADRVEQEARLIANLRHPNIVTVYDFGRHEEKVYLALELVEGEDLATYIDREGACREHFAWAIARQVAAALCYAAQDGVVHRDIKPANLLLTEPPPGGEDSSDVPLVKVTDFGLALQLKTDSDETRLTVAGSALGTLAYVAPEQLDETTVDQQADIYSLGATVYHMLAGEAPFADSSPMKLVVAKTTGDDRWRKKVPEGVSRTTSALFLAMTEHNPADRIGDFVELLERIDTLVGPPDARELQETVMTADRRLRPRRSQTTPVSNASKKKLAALAAAVVALAAALVSLPAVWTGHNSGAIVIEPTWQRGREFAALFDGLNVPLGPQRGSWQTGTSQDDDGSYVLVGSDGWKTLSWKGANRATTVEQFEISFVVDARDSEQIGIHFGQIQGSNPSKPRYVALLRDGKATAGQSTGVEAKVQPLTGQDEVTWRQLGASTTFHSVSIARSSGRWWLSVDGELLANAPTRTNEEIDRVTLQVVGGEAHFADLLVRHVTSPDASGESR